MCIYAPAWIYMHLLHTSALGGQWAWITLQLELQAVVRHLMCVLETDLRLAARALSAFNYWAISLPIKQTSFNAIVDIIHAFKFHNNHFKFLYLYLN